MNFEIYIDSYTFYISVTDYVNVPAQGKWADSDVDCYGYEEIEWNCTEVEDCDEDGNVVELSAEEVKAVISEYSDLIEDKLLEEIRDMRDSHECDPPEPDYYDY